MPTPTSPSYLPTTTFGIETPILIAQSKLYVMVESEEPGRKHLHHRAVQLADHPGEVHLHLVRLFPSLQNLTSRTSAPGRGKVKTQVVDRDMGDSQVWGGKEADLSLASYDLGIAAGAQVVPKPSLSQPQQPQQTLTSDDLMAVWGRVGVQICKVATGLYEKSKRALIGDRTYCGFADATLAQAPDAAAIEILPADIVWLKDAKLKGHKGLHTYTQHVGEGDKACVGIVSEFEVKKFKVRVIQANQHVGQQTVESMSYRMEDMKSGVVKVFQVLEA
ncbi:assembly of actin patch protein [Marasmius sp. AFHP31]|nr:assembly of actin patch protein [Marasmius sp. AFHP31]